MTSIEIPSISGAIQTTSNSPKARSGGDQAEGESCYRLRGMIGEVIELDIAVGVGRPGGDQSTNDVQKTSKDRSCSKHDALQAGPTF